MIDENDDGNVKKALSKLDEETTFSNFWKGYI